MHKLPTALAALTIMGACGDPEALRESTFVETKDGRDMYAITNTLGASQSIDDKIAKLQRSPYIIAQICPDGSVIEEVTDLGVLAGMVPGTTIASATRDIRIKFSCIAPL